MRIIKVKSLKNQQVMSDKCYVAEFFFDRLKGLMGKTVLMEGEAMLFPRCQSVHMWFMKMSLDIIFLKQGKEKETHEVTSIFVQVKPWKLLPLLDVKASEVLELQAGITKKLNIQVGDKLCIN
ncbi:MAG: DUF192 domain-containing protein [Deltaproteobacteria bacterium]|nr:DUF192 domain-containing protein [Deltaproteobacteria bacterium]